MYTRLGQARQLFLKIVVELAALACLSDIAGTDDKVAEPLAVIALVGVPLKDRPQDTDDLFLFGRNLVQLVQAVTDETATEVNIILARRTPNEGDLGNIRPGAAVRATGHTDRDRVILQAKFIDHGIQLGQQIR